MESYNIVKFGIFDDFTRSFNKETITNVLALSHKEFIVSTSQQLYIIDKNTVKKKFPLQFSTFTISRDKDFLIGTTIEEGDLNIYKLSDFLRNGPSNSKSSPNTILSTFSTNQASILHIFYSEKSNAIITVGSGIKVFSVKYRKSDNSIESLVNDLSEKSADINLVITKRSSFCHNYTATVMTAPAFDKDSELILLPTESGIIGYDLNGAKICRCTKNTTTTKTIYATYPSKPSKLSKLISDTSTNLLKKENFSLSKEILTYDSSDGMNLWGNKGQLIHHYGTIRSSVLSIIFIDSENAICINSCNILFYLNIKTGKTFYYMNLEKTPSRLFLTYAKSEPVLCACFGSYLRVLKLVIPWKVWNLDLEKTLSIRRFNKFMSAARILIDAENSFIKFYSPRNGKQLCIAKINEMYRPVSYFYDRGIVENHVFNEQSLSYEPKVTKISNDNDRDILFIILQNGRILGFNPIESNCENISEINCKAAFMSICKISNQKGGFQWCYMVASEKGDLLIFDYFSMKEIMHYNVDDDVLVQLFFEFDSNCIVMVFSSKTILFDIEKGKIIDSIQINGSRLTTLFANFLMYGFDSGHIRRVGIENKKFVFYDNENKKVNRDNKTEIVLKKPHSCPITGFSFAQKIWISSGLDGNIVIWNYDFKIIYKIYLPLPLRSCLIMNGKLEILVATATEIMQIKSKSLYHFLKKEDKIETEIKDIDNFDLIIDDCFKKESEKMISDDDNELEDEYDDEDFDVETANDDSKQKLNRNDNESNNFSNNSAELSTAPLSKLLPNSNTSSSPSNQNKSLNPEKSNNSNKINQDDAKSDSQKVNEKKGKDNSQTINDSKNKQNEKDSKADKSAIDKNNSNSKEKNDKNSAGNKNNTVSNDKAKESNDKSNDKTKENIDKSKSADKEKSNSTEKDKANTSTKTKPSSNDKNNTANKNKTNSDDKEHLSSNTSDKSKANDKTKSTTGDKSKTSTGDKSKSNNSDKTKDNSDSNDKSKESANKKSSTKTKNDSDKDNEKKISKNKSKLENESSNNDENQENIVDKDNKSTKKSNQSKSDTKKDTSSNENDNSEENSKVNDNTKNNKTSKSNSKADSDLKTKENNINDSKSKENSTKDINDNSNSDSKSNSKDNNKASTSNSKTDNDSSSSKINDKDKVSSSNSKEDDVSDSKADSNKLNDSKIIDSSNDENKKADTNDNKKVGENEEIDQSNIENKDDNANSELKEDNKNDEKNENEENNAIDSSISNATNDQSNEESKDGQIDQNKENDQNIMNNENNEIDQNKQENDQNKLTNENNEADQNDKTNENDKENENNKLNQNTDENENNKLNQNTDENENNKLNQNTDENENNKLNQNTDENENNKLNQNTDENENKQENENTNNVNNNNDESGSSVDMEGIEFLDEIDQNKENEQNTASKENAQNNESEIKQNEELDQIRDDNENDLNENIDNQEDAQNGNENENEEDNAEPIQKENECENEKENENENEERNQNENDEINTQEDQQPALNNDDEDNQNDQRFEEVPFTGEYVRVPPPNVVIDKDELFELYQKGRREFKPLVEEVLHEEEVLDNWHRNLQYVQNMTKTISMYDEYQKQKKNVKGFTLNPKSPKHAHSARARRIDSPRDTFITENSKSMTMESNQEEKITRRTATTPPASPSSNRSSLPKIKRIFYPASYVHNYNNNYDTQTAIATPRLFGHFSSIDNMVDEVDSNKNNDFSPFVPPESNSPRKKTQLPPLLYSQPINSDAQIESPLKNVRSPDYSRTAPSPRRQLKQTV